MIVLREGEPADTSETYLRLEDGSAVWQKRSPKPFWRRMQWSCEPGTTSSTVELQFHLCLAFKCMSSKIFPAYPRRCLVVFAVYLENEHKVSL